MSEIAQLLHTLKRELRAQGRTYRDVAALLELSEPSVKRLFRGDGLSLGRLARLADWLGYSLAELMARATPAALPLQCLTEAQEAELVADERRLLVAVCALNHWSCEEITACYALPLPEVLGHLLHLERLGVIRLLPGNRIRLCVGRDFDWLPDGPIQRYFEIQGQPEFLTDGFAGEASSKFFVHGMLGPQARQMLMAELNALRQRFADLHAASLSVPFAERRGVGLLLACRAWEPAVFARYRRPVVR